MHLTNNAINRKAGGGSGAAMPQNWTLATFFAALEKLDATSAPCAPGDASGGGNDSGEHRGGGSDVGGKRVPLPLPPPTERKAVLWRRIKDLVADVLSRARAGIETALHAAMGKDGDEQKCFELFGFDVVVDETLR